MPLKIEEVVHVAKLARLAFSEKDRELLRGQLDKVLESMTLLEKFDTKDVPPTSHVVPLANVTRDDEPRPWPDPDALLDNAPDREDRFFKVPKVIE